HAAPTQHAATSQHAAPTQQGSTSSLRSLLVRKSLASQDLTKTINKMISPLKVKPSLTQARTRPSPSLTHPTVSIEAATGPSPTHAHPSASTELHDSALLTEATRLEEAHVK
ncbi:unnamed protein product, partial [Merluccius merluccius]